MYRRSGNRGATRGGISTSRASDNANRDRSSSGPLMTSHLKDLELELALLKRKRELMISMEQQSLFNKSNYGESSGSNYVQPQQPYTQMSYARYYDEQPQCGNSDNRQGTKRPYDSVRADNSSPKRIPGLFSNLLNKPSPNPTQQRTKFSGPDHTRQGPKPLMRAKPRQYPNNNQHNKVTKPKTVPPNKMHSYPVGERKKLVAKASDSLNQDRDSNLILRPHVMPSNTLNGRLELALGYLVKQMREVHGENQLYSAIFTNGNRKRALNLVLRKRIREVMMGKYVGSSHDVQASYRLAYPEETDIELLDSLPVQNVVKERPPSPVTLEEYFEQNFTNYFDAKLDELLKQLLSLYKAKPIKNSEFETMLNALSTEKDLNDVVLVEDREGQKSNINNVFKPRYYMNIMDILIRRRLPVVLPKFKDQIIQILQADPEFLPTKVEMMKTAIEKSDENDILYKKQINTPPRQRSMTTNSTLNLPYYVKILGRPALPERTVMREFLDTFSPATIKKHKTIRNLLFVGFNNKSDYDKILASNRITFGNNELSIRSSGRQEDPKSRARLNDSDVVLVESKESPIHILDDDVLNNQISELLSSIREEEEVQNSKGESSQISIAEVEVASHNPLPVIDEESEDVQTDENINNEMNTTNKLNVDQETQGDTKEIQNNTVETQNAIAETGNATKEMQLDTEETQNDTDQTHNDNGGNQDETKGTEDASAETDNDSKELQNNTEVTQNDKEKNQDNTAVIEVADDMRQDDDRDKESNTCKTGTDQICNDDQSSSAEGNEIVPNEDANSENPVVSTADKQKNNEKVVELKAAAKESGKATPTRSSSRLANATPGSIRTRRASRLAQN